MCQRTHGKAGDLNVLIESTGFLAQHSRNHFFFMKGGRLLRKRPLAMTRTMRFVIAKRNRSLRPYSVIASEAKQSFSHKQTIPLDKGR